MMRISSIAAHSNDRCFRTIWLVGSSLQGVMVINQKIAMIDDGCSRWQRALAWKQGRAQFVRTGWLTPNLCAPAAQQGAARAQRPTNLCAQAGVLRIFVLGRTTLCPKSINCAYMLARLAAASTSAIGTRNGSLWITCRSMGTCRATLNEDDNSPVCQNNCPVAQMQRTIHLVPFEWKCDAVNAKEEQSWVAANRLMMLEN